jgi:ribosomal protein S18 acetylase RimI-like enzyme
MQFLYDAAAICVVAESLVSGEIVGCGTAKVVCPDMRNTTELSGHILTLAVDPAWRRKGVGRDVLEVGDFEMRLM